MRFYRNELMNLLGSVLANETFDVDGKICMGISGGLDSRIMAAIYTGRYIPIDLSYCQYRNDGDFGESKRGLIYSNRVVKELEIKNHYEICVDDDFVDLVKDMEILNCNITDPQWRDSFVKSRMVTGLRRLEIAVGGSLKEYTFIGGHGLDVFMGGAVNLFSILKGNYLKADRYMVARMIEAKLNVKVLYEHFFKEAIFPFSNPDFVDWCMELPVMKRMNQKLYRDTMNLYFPEMASIPRDGVDVPPNCNEFKYQIALIRRWINKKRMGFKTKVW